MATTKGNKMANYMIIKCSTGHEFGIYEADSEEGAIQAMLDDAGHDGPADDDVIAREIYYHVGWGGRPPELGEEFDDLDEAIICCHDMAVNEVDDESTIVDWGDSPETGWGSCPEDDDGAYWPTVTRRVR